MSDVKKEFWDRLEDVRAGMLGLSSDGRLVPMSPNFADDAIWFITALGTDLVTALTAGGQAGQFVVSDGNQGIYAHIEGQMALSEDKKTLDEIWSAMASIWFEDGKQDADLRLIKFTPRKADVWFTETNPVKFFFETAKAKVTEERPDAGRQVQISFDG